MYALYNELADWYPLLTAPEDYIEEVALFTRLFDENGAREAHTLLELGCGAGHVASHLKSRYLLTLVDLSADMLSLSRAQNPECEHAQGDMRTVRLGRLFDIVFVHDAVVYMLTEDDLRAAIETAAAHCAPGGLALFAPDHVRETFEPGTDTGGYDGDGRALRYLEWSYDPEPGDTTVETDFALVLHEAGAAPRVVLDHHTEGLFAREDWLRLLRSAGFETKVVHDPWNRDLFVARKVA